VRSVEIAIEHRRHTPRQTRNRPNLSGSSSLKKIKMSPPGAEGPLHHQQVQSINGNFGDLESKYMALRQDCNLLLFSVVTGQQATQCKTANMANRALAQSTMAFAGVQQLRQQLVKIAPHPRFNPFNL
jgi:hypothetical protein